MSILFDKNRLETPLKKMPDSIVTMIEPLCVNTIEKMHPMRQVSIRCLDEKMVMIRHQAICVTDPAESINNVTQDLEESRSITVVEEDALSRIPTAGDVIESSFEFQP